MANTSAKELSLTGFFLGLPLCLAEVSAGASAGEGEGAGAEAGAEAGNHLQLPRLSRSLPGCQPGGERGNDQRSSSLRGKQIGCI